MGSLRSKDWWNLLMRVLISRGRCRKAEHWEAESDCTRDTINVKSYQETGILNEGKGKVCLMCRGEKQSQTEFSISACRVAIGECGRREGTLRDFGVSQPRGTLL